jgi:arylsulfatase A-like enzyme
MLGLLQSVGVAGLVGMAGCSGDDGSETADETPTGGDTPTETGAPTDETPTEGDTPTETGAPTETDGPATPGGEAVFAVFDMDPSGSSVPNNTPGEVSVTVVNNGDGSGTQSLALLVDGDEIDTREVSLEAGEETTVTFRVDTAGLSPGEYTLTAESSDDDTGGTLTVIERPNILFLFAEDWNWGTVWDDPALETPALDQIASDGVAFNQAYCSAPSCSPSRSAVLSGQHFWRTETSALLWGNYPDDLVSYPGVLAEQSDYHVGHGGKGYGPDPDLDESAAGEPYEDENGDAEFGRFLEEREGDEPFCFWEGTFPAHRDFPGLDQTDVDPPSVNVPPYLPDTEDIRKDIAKYYAHVENIDDRIAELKSTLEDAGELENTMFVVTGDHGFAFPRAKTQLYDAGTRVPFVVHWPAAVDGGRESSEFINFPDVGPTFLEAAGVEVPEAMTGDSFLDALAAPASSSRPDEVFLGMERHVPGQEDGDCPEGYPTRAIRTDEYLYIHNFDPDNWPMGTPNYGDSCGPQDRWLADADNGFTKYVMYANRDRGDLEANERGDTYEDLYDLTFGKRPAEELYVLAEDPHQMNNVASTNQDVVEELRGRLMDELEATDDPRVVEDDPPFDDMSYAGGYIEYPGGDTIEEYELP